MKDAYLDFVVYTVGLLVDKKEKVIVAKRIDNETGKLTLDITVDPSDVGKIIGKSGNIADALRTLTRAIGSKHDTPVHLKVIDYKSTTK